MAAGLDDCTDIGYDGAEAEKELLSAPPALRFRRSQQLLKHGHTTQPKTCSTAKRPQQAQITPMSAPATTTIATAATIAPSCVSSRNQSARRRKGEERRGEERRKEEGAK